MAAILVVDDEPEIVTLLRFVLEADGHTVQSAGHGVEALEKLGVEIGKIAERLADRIAGASSPPSTTCLCRTWSCSTS